MSIERFKSVSENIINEIDNVLAQRQAGQKKKEDGMLPPVLMNPGDFMQDDLQGQSMKDDGLTEKQKEDRENYYAMMQLNEKWIKMISESIGE